MTKRVDPFESPKRRLARAKQHICRFEKRIQTFIKKKPYDRTEDTQADGTTIHALKFTRDFPDSWTDAAVESLEALRSALDQTGYAAAVLGGTPEPKNAYFPMGDTIADLDSVTGGRCKDLPAEVRTLFRGFDAHEGGNYALWALNKLCNANKHRLLIPVGVGGGEMTMNRGIISGGDLYAPRWNGAKNQLEFATIRPGGNLKYDAKITFHIAFDEFNKVKGGPAVGILNTIADEVQRVLLATKAECQRIGLLK
ncbi:MAG TPA: hypothetical protein VFC54_10210 [Pseudolabrys sp.]|nr:hypothetical protein [Pseudolabrys sp.]